MLDKNEIFATLKGLLSQYAPPCVVTGNTDSVYHLYGTKPASVGKSSYDGIYFASAVIRKSYVALHFFPIYTHVDQFENISEDLRKCLKGKSCFHIKRTDDPLFEQIKKALDKGVAVYQKEGWL